MRLSHWTAAWSDSTLPPRFSLCRGGDDIDGGHPTYSDRGPTAARDALKSFTKELTASDLKTHRIYVSAIDREKLFGKRGEDFKKVLFGISRDNLEKCSISGRPSSEIFLNIGGETHSCGNWIAFGEEQSSLYISCILPRATMLKLTLRCFHGSLNAPQRWVWTSLGSSSLPSSLLDSFQMRKVTDSRPLFWFTTWVNAERQVKMLRKYPKAMASASKQIRAAGLGGRVALG